MKDGEIHHLHSRCKAGGGNGGEGREERRPREIGNGRFALVGNGGRDVGIIPDARLFAVGLIVNPIPLQGGVIERSGDGF